MSRLEECGNVPMDVTVALRQKDLVIESKDEELQALRGEILLLQNTLRGMAAERDFLVNKVRMLTCELDMVHQNYANEDR